jgi:oxygen-independent coproporphyrinogen-3 oxidase
MEMLYVHVPFCLRKCGYCAFVSQEPQDGELAEYTELLLREIELRLHTGTPLTTIYFGGGTPSMLQPAQLARVLGAVAERSGIAEGAEITLEMNPGTAEPAALLGFRRSGINRLSIGVQSFADSMLQHLGRVHSAGQAHQAYRDARSAGFDNISIDLMHSLPGQTLEEWQKELRTAVELEPEHISIYGLSIEEGTRFARIYPEQSPELADEDLAADMFEAAHNYLTAAGYEHYEIANYARPGRRSRHNSGYWQRHGYCGIGVAAHSFVRDGHGVRFSNSDDLDRYRCALNTGLPERCDEQVLSLREAMAEYLFLGLRLAEGVELAAFAREFGRSFHAEFGAHAASLLAAGLLVEGDGRVKLTVAGMQLSNQVFVRFL